MSMISTVTLPDGSLHEIGRAVGAEYIQGTWNTATNVWTGVTKDSQLYDGKEIVLFLPFSGTTDETTLELTCNEGSGQATGPKNVYFSGTVRHTNQYEQYSMVRMVYHQQQMIGSTPYEGWWTEPGLDTNDDTTWQLRYNGSVKAAAAITEGAVIVGASAGYKNIAEGVSFDLSYPILWAGSGVAVGATNTNTYEASNDVDLSVVLPGWTGTQHSEVFLVLSGIVGNVVTVDANIFTTQQPAEEDGKFYIPLGLMTSTTNCLFHPRHELYQYRGGSFHQVTAASLPLAAKKYPPHLQQNQSNDGTVAFIRVIPNNMSNFNEPWKVRYRLYVSTEMPECQGYFDCEAYQVGVTTNYKMFNNIASTAYPPIYAHRIFPMTSTNMSSGAYIGCESFNAYNDASLARIYTVELIEAIGCKATLLDSLLTYENLDRSKFGDVSVDARIQGLQETGDVDTNTYDRTLYSQAVVKIWDAYIAAGNIIVGKNNVYQPLNSGQPFDIRYPILYLDGGQNAGSTAKTAYSVIPFIITTTQEMTLIPQEPIYIKGKLNGTMFTPASTSPLTQEIPTSGDGYMYIHLGVGYSASAAYLTADHDMYMYIGGKFQRVSGMADMQGQISIALPTTSWVGEIPNLSQTVTIPGLTANTQLMFAGINYPDNVTSAQKKAINQAMGCLTEFETSANALTIYACRLPAEALTLVFTGVGIDYADATGASSMATDGETTEMLDGVFSGSAAYEPGTTINDQIELLNLTMPYCGNSLIASGDIPATGTTSYTATQNCIYLLMAAMHANGNYIMRITINGVQIFNYESDEAVPVGLNNLTFPLRKGSTISVYFSSNRVSRYAVLAV